MCQLLVYPVKIGNRRGERQLLPGPVWKVEDQQGDRAKTSGGNSSDDDDQGGNMPSWMFKEESNREEETSPTQEK